MVSGCVVLRKMQAEIQFIVGLVTRTGEAGGHGANCRTDGYRRARHETSVFTRIFSVRNCRVAPQWLIHGHINSGGPHLHGSEGGEVRGVGFCITVWLATNQLRVRYPRWYVS